MYDCPIYVCVCILSILNALSHMNDTYNGAYEPTGWQKNKIYIPGHFTTTIFRDHRKIKFLFEAEKGVS